MKRIDAVALASVPLLAELFSGLHLSPNAIDAWLYYAYGTDYQSLLARFGWTYYASRLSWNLIVGLFFLVFSPAVAVFLLGTVISCLGSFSLYAILRCYYARVPAFLAAFALAANVWYLGDAFWLYVDSPSIAFSLFAIAGFLYALRSGKLPGFCLSGIALTVGINAHPITLALVLPAAGFILLAEGAVRSRRAWAGIAAFCAAAAATMLALCVTAWLVFGNFWFFSPSIASAEWVVSGGWHNWVVPFSVWIPGATAFFMPIGVLLAGAVVFGRGTARTGPRPDAWIAAYAVLLALCVVVSDAVLNAGRLQHTYYFIYLWVPAFLLFGGVIADLLDAESGSTVAAVAASEIVCLAPLLVGAEYWRLLTAHPAWTMAIVYTAVAALYVPFLAVVLVPGRLPRHWRAIGVVAGMAFLSLSTAADARLGTLRLLWQSVEMQPELNTTVTAQKFIESNVDPERKLLIWYNHRSAGREQFTAISSVFAFEYSALNRSMPELTDADMRKIDRPASVVILAADTDEATKALGILQDEGLVERVAAKTVLGPLGRRISLWMVDTHPTAAVDEKASGRRRVGSGEPLAQISTPLPIDWSHAMLLPGGSAPPDRNWPLTLQTPPQPWAYGVVLPLAMSPTGSPLHVRITVRVLAGKAGFGLLNHAQAGFLQREFVAASPNPVTVVLTAPGDQEVGPLVVQTAEAAGSAQVVVDSADRLTALSPVPMSVDWGRVERPVEPATAFPLEVRMVTQPNATAAIIPCQLAHSPGGAPLWIIVHARVTGGEAAFVLVNATTNVVLDRKIIRASDQDEIVMLKTIGSSDAFRVVVQSGLNAVASTVSIENVSAAAVP